MTFVHDDGGRTRSGMTGKAGDCVTRAIAIATGKAYGGVWYDLKLALDKDKVVRESLARGYALTPDKGVPRRIYEPYLSKLGWKWVPTMGIGTGCKVHLRPSELPKGRIIARCSRHLVACIDGVPHDTFDPTRLGTRCVYGYFIMDPTQPR